MKPTKSPVMAWTAKHALAIKPAALFVRPRGETPIRDLAIEILQTEGRPMEAQDLAFRIGCYEKSVRAAMRKAAEAGLVRTTRRRVGSKDLPSLYEAL